MQCLYAPVFPASLHLVSAVFATAIPTSLYILGKYVIYLFVSFLGVHHIGGCCTLLSGIKKQICDHRQPLLCVRGCGLQEEIEDHHLEKGLSPFKKS